jgi:hypothetical protein
MIFCARMENSTWRAATSRFSLLWRLTMVVTKATSKSFLRTWMFLHGKKSGRKTFWKYSGRPSSAALRRFSKNHPKDQLATKVPISGSYTNSSVGIWTATATLLQNVFIHALVPKLDQRVTVDQVEKNEDKK